jgi:uncharacterized integral membrane protein (TIGR00697 family)
VKKLYALSPDNLTQGKTGPLILLLAMVFITASLAADVIAYKFLLIGPLLESGATIVFPITYVIGDVITEVYGYPTIKRIIWIGLGCELLFALIINFIIHSHALHRFPYQEEYKHVLGGILTFVVSCIIADIASSFANVYIISKFKIFLKGRFFALRSIFSTAIGELIMNIIACLLAFLHFTTFYSVVHIILSAYALELVYAVICVVPAQFLCIILKRAENIDAYDYNVNYNIFSFSDFRKSVKTQ